VLIWREFGVLYNRHYVCTLLSNMGVSFQKARFVSDHLDAAKRLAWLQDKWPAIVRAAKRCKGLILFEDEASFAQWGSLSYTWARRGCHFQNYLGSCPLLVIGGRVISCIAHAPRQRG